MDVPNDERETGDPPQDPTVPGLLDRFTPPTRSWFTAAFDRPTPAQAGAWDAVSAGEHALVVAPTGSGKTLAAFLWALDRLAAAGPSPTERRCRVLYVSPLKALAVDVERNLRSPLTGIRQEATRLGQPVPDIRVAVRSGDTPAAERRAFGRNPPDILITTPESLFLLLTSAARASLTGVQTVIVDEVHAMAGAKRGAHLALSLERLDALMTEPAQRVGLSATVRPVEDVARWLAGTGQRPVRIVQPAPTKEFDLRVVVPVPDMTDLDSVSPPGLPAPGRAAEPDPPGLDRLDVAGIDLSGPAAGAPKRPSIWPHVEERVVDLIAEHRSTLVFVNSRRLAERLTARLNEIWAERHAEEPQEVSAPTRPPAQVLAASGVATGAPAILARAHHGSVSKEQRAVIESELKAGRLPAVVATSSLELGIDMGAVDLVVQVESPPSVAGGLQRVGRAGHQVGAVSRGVLFPKFRSDLVQTAVVVERMADGAIEALRVPANPLDVLAQQIVAMVALDDWSVDDVYRLVVRAAPYATLTRPVFDAVLDMLSGRYPGEEFAELRPRLVWDRIGGGLSARPGAQRLAVTSGGTIPDRGLFGVFLAGDGPGRRVGELDEEMVYESRVGDVFTLGSSTWRIEQITHDQVLVTPAPGQPGRLPFWHGDALGRSAELGRAVGSFVRELTGSDRTAAHRRAREAGLDEWAADNLVAYLDDQREHSGVVPDDRTIVLERFRDELGDWRLVIHSPFGAQVHAPWALAVSARLRERFGVDVQAMPGDDGIVLRLPDVETDDGSPPQVADQVLLLPEEISALVTEELGGSAMFASRFRECAGRALLLPRRRPGQRQALWQQRQRAAQLLEVAGRYPAFPIVLETVRECLQDVFDVPGLERLMRDLQSRAVRLVEVTSDQPSPFARSLMFGYIAQFLYEGDSPLAERRAAALTLDPTLLSELLGTGEGASLRDLLDPEALARTEAELQHLAAHRRLVGVEGVADLLRLLGPLTETEVAERTLPERLRATDVGGSGEAGPTESDAPDPPPVPLDVVTGWLETLQATRRAIRVRLGGRAFWAAVEDAGRLRDGLGTPLPVGVAEVFTEPVTDPLADLLTRYARCHGPFTAPQIAERYGLGVAVVIQTLRRLVAAGRIAEGELRPLESGGGHGMDYCDREVLRVLRRRSVAALRAEVEPVTATDLALFLPAWHGLGADGARLRGVDGVLSAVEQLAGALIPASALETLILPARVIDYSPGMLDELLTANEVTWSGHGSLPGEDGWISLHPTDLAPLTLAAPGETPAGDLPAAVLDALAGGGGHFFRGLSDAVGGPADPELATVLWDLVWAGLITNDTLSALRTHLRAGSGGGAARRGRRTGPRTARARYRARSGLTRPAMPSRTGPPTTIGRWSLLPVRESDPTLRAHAQCELLLERYGVLTRGSVAAEQVSGGFSAVYRVLSAFEDAGRVRRGYFVEGLGAAQFATTGAVDRLRAASRPIGATGRAAHTLVLAATDPANPYGAALAWPEVAGSHRPGRKAGALVVLSGGELVLYVERGGRSLLSWSQEPEVLQSAADALALAVRDGALGRLTVQKADGEHVLGAGSPLAGALEAAGFHPTPRGLRMRA